MLSVSPSVAGGGAERVALTLHERYLADGIDSWLAVANVNADAERVLQIPVDAERGQWASSLLRASRAVEGDDADGGRGPTWAAARALRMLAEPARVRRVLRGHEDFEFPWTCGLLELPPLRPDVLHLHNLHGSYFDVRALPELTAQVPTVLTLHDTWLLTGHCAQPFDCERWRTGCGKCPDLGRYVPIWGEESAANREVKRQAILGSQLGIAVPSRWLLDMIDASGLLGEGREGRVIPNGVDTDVFRPGSREAAREALGLPQDRRIVMLAAKGIRDNPYKGFDDFAEAVRRLSDDIAEDLLIIALGDEGEAEPLGRAELRPVPFVGEPATVAEYYRAADVFVLPSRAENLPLVLIEAMACGTAVVATRVGGVPEVVEDGVSGALVEVGDVAAMSDCLAGLLSEPRVRERLASTGAARVARDLSLSRQVGSYLSWYEELMSQRIAARRSR